MKYALMQDCYANESTGVTTEAKRFSFFPPKNFFYFINGFIMPKNGKNEEIYQLDYDRARKQREEKNCPCL